MKHLLTISQVLLYYDLPQIMVATNTVGTRFISLLVEVTEYETKYISTQISSRRLAHLLSGELDLRDVFEQPEIEEYYSFDYNSEQIEADLLVFDNLPSNYLPDRGFIFDKKNDEQDIITEAVEKNNAVVHLSLSDSEDNDSILADNLGDILKYYQLTIENGFKKKVSQVSNTQKQLYLKPENYKLRAFASSPGSFNIHLFSTADINVYGASAIDIALNKFDDLLKNNQTDEELLITLRSVKGHTVSSLSKLLSKVIELNVKIKHKWYAPDQKEVHVTTIDKNKAERINTLLNSAVELAEEIKEFTGYFEQVDTDKGTWRILNKMDTKDYSGTCSPGISLQGITVDSSVLYTLVCNEIIEEGKVSEKEKTKFILLSIEKANI